MSAGMAKFNVVDQPYLLKPVPMNPYIGAVHDGRATEYNTGYALKNIPFLYRFRHNLYPGMQTGFFSRNPGGKSVHWLEVSTIEKMRIRAMSEEAFPPMVVSAVVILFTLYHCYRYAAYHPDLTMYNLALWTTKPWIRQMRFSEQHPLDKPIFRFVQRVPEIYNVEDPYKVLIRNGSIANDPYLEAVKELGLTDKITTKPGAGSLGPDVVHAVSDSLKGDVKPAWRWQP
jgi:hypothetical protein